MGSIIFLCYRSICIVIKHVIMQSYCMHFLILVHSLTRLLFYRNNCRDQNNTHTHPFNGPLSGTTRVSQYQKGKTNLDFTEARDSEWQWHQLDHMQVCISFQTDNHASTIPLSFFTGRMPFLLPNQQRQSTENLKISRNELKKHR